MKKFIGPLTTILFGIISIGGFLFTVDYLANKHTVMYIVPTSVKQDVYKPYWNINYFDDDGFEKQIRVRVDGNYIIKPGQKLEVKTYIMNDKFVKPISNPEEKKNG